MIRVRFDRQRTLRPIAVARLVLCLKDDGIGIRYGRCPGVSVFSRIVTEGFGFTGGVHHRKFISGCTRSACGTLRQDDRRACNHRILEAGSGHDNIIRVRFDRQRTLRPIGMTHLVPCLKDNRIGVRYGRCPGVTVLTCIIAKGFGFTGGVHHREFIEGCTYAAFGALRQDDRCSCDDRLS